MDRSRIGAAESGAAEPEASSAFITRASEALASPLGVLIVVPTLVIGLGAILAVGGQAALRGSNLEAAQSRLVDQATLVARSVRDALDDADPILDRLETRVRSHDPSQPFDSFAHDLAARMAGHAGVTYISVSFPDGTFQGAYVDPDHVVRFQDARIGPHGTTVRRFELRPDGSLAPLRTETSDYDPRRRGFYRLALAHGARVWTEPYPFFTTHTTGITRASPVFESDGRTIHAVLTVDFDVDALSTFMREHEVPGARALIFDGAGTLIATPWSAAEVARLPTFPDRPLNIRDLHDDVITAFHRAVRSHRGELRGARSLRFQTGSTRYLASVAPSAPDRSLDWTTAYIVPESRFLVAFHRYQERSMSVSAVATLVAFAIAWLFARHITRVKKEAAEARRAANELGSYRLVECLGKGGMGEVWRAKHRLLARDAAIKLIHPRLVKSGDTEAKSRFKREADALAALHSRHTIELFDYGVADDGTFFFVMELLDGFDLESLVESDGPLPAGRVASILAQACSSLAEAHSAGLVHRDIKPANVFVCRAADEVDIVKVLDFGLVGGGVADDVRPMEPRPDPETDVDARLTRYGSMMGTPGFMSPEQIRGAEFDGRTDLYSLGCVGFFLLTGRFVHDGPSPVKIMMAHLQDPLPDLERLVPAETPKELIAVVLRCLAHDKNDRPADALELQRILRSIEFEGPAAWGDAEARRWWAGRAVQPMPERDPTTDRDFQTAKTLVSARDLGSHEF